MTDPTPMKSRRTSLVIAFTWLFLLTVGFAFDHVVLTQEITYADDYADRDALAATQNQLGGLQSRIEAFTDLKPVSTTDFSAAQRALNDRLIAVEHASLASVRTETLAPTLDRIQALEKQIARVKRNAAAPNVPAAVLSSPDKPVLQDPPFSVIGTELRGGERFLSIAPIDAQSIRQFRLIRPGESEGRWRLDAVDRSSALFSVDGVTRRLILP